MPVKLAILDLVLKNELCYTCGVLVLTHGRDGGGGGAGRAIALPLLLLGFISGLQLTRKKFPWNYWTLPYGRVGCLLVRTITTRCARKDNKMQGPNGVI